MLLHLCSYHLLLLPDSCHSRSSDAANPANVLSPSGARLVDVNAAGMAPVLLQMLALALLTEQETGEGRL